MCRIISISNQKGGVGKTTTCMNLGVSLARMGKSVLMVDFDPQANLTMAMGYQQPDEIDITVTHLLAGEINNLYKVDYGNGTEKPSFILNAHGVDFIAANIVLSDIENTLMNAISRENMLKRILSRVSGFYDYILIDCLPSLNILTINALSASDQVIIPVQAQFFSAKGLELLIQTIAKVRANINPNLSIAGALITMLDTRGNFQKEVVNVVKDSYGTHIKVFESKIPTSVKVSESQSQGTTIFETKNNRVADSYDSFAKELIGNE